MDREDLSYMDLMNNHDAISLDQLTQSTNTPSPCSNKTNRGKTSRGPSFSPSEDRLLIAAWLNVSLDPIVGSEQKSSTFWDKIYEFYKANRTSAEHDRSASGLKNRWHVMMPLVTKFHACWTKVERANQSGVTEEDKFMHAKQMYVENHKAQFSLEHCWQLLKSEQKWIHSLEKADNRKKQTPTSSASIDNASVVDTDGRPIGRKAEKERMKRKGTAEDITIIRDTLVDVHERKWAMHEAKMQVQLKQAEQNDARLAIDKRLAEQAELAEDDRILNIDTTGMSPQLVTWYEHRKRLVMQKHGLG